jgi:CHAT domain-containing protein
VLQGAAATRGAFLAGLGRASVVEFGGHAVVHPDLPGRSALVLADGPGGASGALYARDLAGLALPHTELVVLAACGTARGDLSRTDGVASLVHPFLAAGVPAVVASLWNVDDAATARLSLALHRRLAAGEDAAAALRSAQLELLRGPRESLRSPLAWAPFELFGAAVKLGGRPARQAAERR